MGLKGWSTINILNSRAEKIMKQTAHVRRQDANTIAGKGKKKRSVAVLGL